MDENMARGGAITLAAFTVWPFVVPVIGLLAEASGMIPSTATEPPAAFVGLMVMLCLTVIEVLALLLFYLGYLFTRPLLPLEWKAVWAAVLVFGHVFTMPVFWVLQVWKPRHVGPMQAASRFSLLVFAPVLVAFLLPTWFLLPTAVLCTLGTIADPTVSLASIASFDVWAVAPILAALGLFFAGRALHRLHACGRSRAAAWTATWAVFSTAAFVAAWFGLTVLTSVGASDHPIPAFLCWTALVAAALTLCAQALLVPWLIAVSRVWIQVQTRETIEHGLQDEAAAEG
jgi:hypothetical protein